MKKQIKKLTLVKERISTLVAMNVTGGKLPKPKTVETGPPRGPLTLLIEGC
jgi:hypothetical protein